MKDVNVNGRGAMRGAAIACLVLMMQGFAVSGSEARTVVWDKTVIELEMIVGVEQIVIFPTDGVVGLPAMLGHPAMFRTLFTGQTAYWMALESFDRQRIQVKMDSGEYVLFDVSARVEKEPPQTVDRLHVVIAGGSEPKAMGEAMGEGVVHRSGDAEQVTLFELIRYGAQHLYAPTRLVEAVLGIRAIPLGLTGNQTQLYNHGAHPGLVIVPHKAWSVDGLYVTAFVVRNEHSHAVPLDNRKVMHVAQTHRNGVGPHFLASSFFRQTVQKRGDPGDRTTLFVVTDRPIQSVIRGRP